MKTIFSFLLIFFAISTMQSQDKKPADYSIAQLDSLLEGFRTEKVYDNIFSYAQAGADKTAKEYGIQDTTYAKMLYFLGFGYQLRQDFQNAEKHLQKAIDIQKIKMSKSFKYPRSLNNLAVLYYSMGNYALAETLYKETIKIRKEILGEKHPDYAMSLHNLALLYRNSGNYAAGEPLFKEVLKIQKEVLGEKHPDYAGSLNNLAGLYLYTDNYILAESLYKETIKIRKEVLGDKHPDYAGSLNNLAVLYNDKGNYALAEPLYKEAMKIKKTFWDDKHPDHAINLNNLANLYHNMGCDALAEPLYKEALNIRKEVLGQKHPDYAQSLYNLAILYQEMSKYALAEPLYQEAMAVWKEAFSEKHPNYALSMSGLAGLYSDMGNYTLAEPLYKEILKIRKEIFGEKHSAYASSLNNLAALYYDMGNYPLAEPLYLEALKTKKEVFGERHPDYVSNLTNLAHLYLKLKDYKTCWAYVQQGIAVNSGLDISLHISKSWADSLATGDYISMEEMLKTLGLVYKLLAIKDAIQYLSIPQQTSHIIVADLALELLKKSRDDFSDEADKLRTLVISSTWVLAGLEVLDKNTQVDKAFAFAEESKSVLLLDAAQTQQAYSFWGLPDTLVQKEKALQKQKGEYQAGIIEKRPESERDSLRTLLNKLNVEITDFKMVIEKSFPKYATLKYQHQNASITEIQKLLDDKTALLEYVIGDSVVYIFYIDRKISRIFEHRIQKTDLTQKIKDLHHALSDYNFIQKKETEAYQKYTKNAYWFYQNLVAIALSNANGIEQLMIVTDGELGFLPFESFLVEEAPQAKTDYIQLHYLINDYKISYNYSATIWKENKESPKNKNNGQLLAMASNYNIKIDSSKMDFRLPVYQRLRLPLKPLPAAKQEVEILEERFQGYFAFDTLASEKKFKEKASDYAVIHLAMHGLLDENAPILSSLAFTEDGDSLENNFLQAYEISKMKLNADLVVLSACETGYGRFEKGNGIASLAQAFAYAGAPALIVSLWQVSDYATSEIMKNLYQNLANGMEKDEALQQAKIQYMKNAKGVLAHPAFWSPFIQMGNTNAIYLKTKGGWLFWIVGTTVLFGLIAGLFFWKRKSRLS